MTRLLALLVPMFLVAAVPTPDRVAVKDSVPVVDLRVGLSRSLFHGEGLAKGLGQAGYVELVRGGVKGIVLPFPVPEREAARRRAPESAFLSLRDALSLSQRFKRDGCNDAVSGIGTWLSLEAPDELARSPDQVGLWATRGVRLFAIGGMNDNGLATSAAPTGPGAITGLTAAGRDVVQRILAAGALIDVSNASEPSIDDVTDLAAQAGVPVVAGHANARSLADSPWNLSDPQLRGIAKTGGLVGVTARHGMLATGRNATLRHVVEQIRHIVRVAGPDHVALGSSFEDGVGPVADFKSAADYPRLARALGDAGFSRDIVERVFYKNALRVLCAKHDAGASMLPKAAP